MGKYATFKSGYGRSNEHGKWVQERTVGRHGNLKPYASKKIIRKEFQERNYKLSEDHEVQDIRTDQNLGWHVAVGIIEKETDELNRYLRIDTYSTNEQDIEYKVWIHTEDKLPNPRQQLKEKMDRLVSIFPTASGLQEAESEVGETVLKEEVTEAQGTWRGKLTVKKYNPDGKMIKKYDSYEAQGTAPNDPENRPSNQTLYEV